MDVRANLQTAIHVEEDDRSAPAFDEMFLAHYEPTVRILCRLVGSTARAEELAADLFLKLYHRPLRA